MTTATPLSLPFVLDQRDSTAPSHLYRRPWKPERPNYRALLTAHRGETSLPSASSRTATSTKSARLESHPDQLEADVQEWGLPSSSSTSRLAPPTSAISWDENSAQASCSYLQNRTPSNRAAAPTSLDQWDPSISFAPYSSSALAPIPLKSSPDAPLRYDPGLGRVVAIGRDDGKVTIYRAYGRSEDYDSPCSKDQQAAEPDDSLPVSSSASVHLSHTSRPASVRSSVLTSPTHVRSPEAATPSIRLPSSAASHSTSSYGREPSPLLSAFSPIDRSSAARSTISTASASSAVAANVQLDEGLPADSLQSNVNATGHTAGRKFGDEAENRLEQQMAAAGRNDHQHGMVGGVIERLGFSSHSHSQAHPPSSHHPTSKEPLRRSHHGTRSSAPVTPPPASPSIDSLGTAKSHSNAPIKAQEPVTPERGDVSLQPSASDAWLHAPNRGSFSPVMTLYTRDRSPVVALRLIPSSAGSQKNDSVAAAPTPVVSESTALLVVQEAGTVSLWSILEGTMVWQSDLTTAQVVPTGMESSEPTTKESATLGVMQSLSRLPAAIGTPRTRSPAGSARASPKPTLLPGDASLRRSLLRTALSGPDASSNSRLLEVRGVKLGEAVQTMDVHGAPIALVWDSHSSSALMLHLLDGKVLLREALDDVLPASTPTLRLDPQSHDLLQLLWFSECEHQVQKQLIRILTSEVANGAAQSDPSGGPQVLQGFAFDRKAESQHGLHELWSLPGDAGPAQKIHFLVDQVLVQGSEQLSILDSATGQQQHTQEVGTGQYNRIIGSSRDSQHLLLQPLSGLARLDLSPTRSNDADQVGSSHANFDLLASPTPCRLSLAWNLPSSGDLLDKVFLLQPSSNNDADTSMASKGSAELVSFDVNTSHTEELLADSGPDASHHKASNAEISHAKTHRITAVLPLSLEKIAVASQGGIRLLSLSSLTAGNDFSSTTAIGNSLGSDHEICLLRSAVAPRAAQRLIIGGTMQGEVGFWDANLSPTQPVPHLEAALSVSTTPVEALIVFGDDDNTIRLHGCLACICADSSVTIVLLEGFRLQYTIPGRGARLTSIAVRADELLLTYDDDKARVWDLRTQELRRSIATDQAQALVEDGKGWWTVKPIEAYSPLHSGTTGVLSQLASARDEAAASLLVDFRRAIEAAARSVRGPAPAGGKDDAAPRSATATSAGLQPAVALRSEQGQDQKGAAVSLGSAAARKAVNIIRPLLPTVFPTGLDTEIDAKLAALLDLEHPSSALAVGLRSIHDALMMGVFDKAAAGQDADVDRTGAWKLSSRLTTTRLLVASALLRVLGYVSEFKRLTEDLRHFVEQEANLASLVGVGFRGVRITDLVPFWLDSNSELQNASRDMFQGAVARLDQEELDRLCDEWESLLSPAAKTAPTSAKMPVEVAAPTSPSEQTELQARALALLGSIAVERYTSMSPRLLKDIAKSIHGAIASDKGSDSRLPNEAQMLAVAIELCRIGFSMWQHYLDAAEVVRSLFALSTSTSTSSSTTTDGDLRNLARAATLQIAAENTPLFMTTLTLDILHARSPAHCSATMRLVAFMVRKRPSVLVANLPRLAEAVVKSLDPTHTTMREAVVNAATVMIGELVSTYPSVSFFGAGQRLAVATHEGAVIMYDLKTATRLYVLEGHRRRADAVSFGPDGRRLVTLSLEEGRVLIWKTSSGFSAFFSPGQMPRQGATDVKLTDGAYKAFLFNVGDQQQTANRIAQTGQHQGENQEQDFVGFDRISFQWHSERSVKVQIGEAQLNISVD